MTAIPSIVELNLTEEDDFVVLASDGLWDVMNEEQAQSFIYDWRNNSLSTSVDQENVSAALISEATRLISNDNITVCVLFLKRSGKGARQDKIEYLHP